MKDYGKYGKCTGRVEFNSAKAEIEKLREQGYSMQAIFDRLVQARKFSQTYPTFTRLIKTPSYQQAVTPKAVIQPQQSPDKAHTEAKKAPQKPFKPLEQAKLDLKRMKGRFSEEQFDDFIKNMKPFEL